MIIKYQTLKNIGALFFANNDGCWYYYGLIKFIKAKIIWNSSYKKIHGFGVDIATIKKEPG